MKKRIFSFGLALALILSICPWALADDAQQPPAEDSLTSTQRSENPGVADVYFLPEVALFLMNDGTVRLWEDENLQYGWDYTGSVEECLSWTDITQMASCQDVIVGLRADGTVAAAGDAEFVSELSIWDHITAVYGLSGDHHIILGLREDGSVLAVGYDAFPDDYITRSYDDEEDDDNDYNDGRNLSSFIKSITSWQNVSKLIVGVNPDGSYAAALHTDGSVSPSWVYADREYLKGFSREDFFIDLDSSGWGIIALTDEGTCAYGGENAPNDRTVTDTWTDLKQVECGDNLAIGLRNDGTFVTTRKNTEDWPDAVSEEFASLRDIDRFEILGWENKIAVYHTDGSVEFFKGPNDSGNDQIRTWTDIAKLIPFSYDSDLEFIGIKTDGSFVSSLEGIQIRG